MAALESQIIDDKEFIDILDYEFTGNDVTVSNKRKFIEQLRQRAAVYVAAHHTGINKVTAYRWKDSDPEFAKAWDEALEDAADVMESSTYEEALNGNALLKMFWLKAHRPKYRDRVSVDIAGIQDEINERLERLGLRELPPAMATTTVDDSDNHSVTTLEPETPQFPSLPASEQKEQD